MVKEFQGDINEATGAQLHFLLCKEQIYMKFVFSFAVYTLCPVGLNCEETRAKRLFFHQVQKAWLFCIFGSHTGSTVNVGVFTV